MSGLKLLTHFIGDRQSEGGTEAVLVAAHSLSKETFHGHHSMMPDIGLQRSPMRP